MNRTVARAAIAATAAAGLALTLSVTGAGAAGARGGVGLRLVEVGTAVHLVDAPADAADGQAGDVGIFESDLLRDGTVVGSLAGHCIQVRADGTLDDCDVTVTVGASSYRMSGPFDPATGGTLTVTGGTGAWTGASGTDEIVNQPDGTAVHIISLDL